MGRNRSVAVSSVVAVSATIAKAAPSPGGDERQRDAAEHRPPAAAQGSGDLLDARRHLGQRRADRGEGEREEQHDIPGHEHRRLLIQRLRVANPEVHHRQSDGDARQRPAADS
ncbi:hypothetical protein ABIA39_008282 [Nocardia sp. GAS34]